jgi:RNA polymerase sigma-70 factor (ECF subfamily)
MSAVTAAKVTSQLTDAEFDQLFRDHYQLVYRTAFTVTRSAEDAEDVLQTVFLRLVRRRFPPGLKKNPKAYLYRAAFNRAVDIVRARPRDISPADAERLAKVVSPDWKLAEEAERRLYDGIASLHPASVQILMLRYVHNHSLAEIASLLGTTRSTVAVSLFRSRARLRKLIRALGETS